MLQYKTKITQVTAAQHVINKITALLQMQLENGVVTLEQLTKIQNLAANKEQLKSLLKLL